jgi:hypothetical protein
MWVGRVWDRNVGGLFLFMLAVAHGPRVVNEAFDLRTVGQLQLDQLTQNFKLGAENNRVRKPGKRITRRIRTFVSQSAAKNPPSRPLKGSTFTPRSSSQNTVLSELFEYSANTPDSVLEI